VVRQCPPIDCCSNRFAIRQLTNEWACKPASLLIDTAELVAELRGIGMDELARIESENALRVFTRIA
jgi:hypothetical protein